MPEGLWYFSQNNERHGPVPFTQLQEMARSGRLRSTDLVWTDNMADWAPAHRIDGLGAAPQVPAPPTPLPPPAVTPAFDQDQARGLVPEAVPAPAAELSVTLRHAFATLFAGAFVDWLLFHPLLVPAAAESRDWERILLAIIAFLLSLAVVVLPVGRLVKGHWPLAALLDEFLGSRTSARRHTILSVAGGLLAYLILFAPSADSGPTLESGRAVFMAFAHLFGCIAAATFVVGFALNGEFPLAARIRGLLGGRRINFLSPRARHVLLTILIGFGLGLGSWLWEVFKLMSADVDLGPLGDPRIGVWRGIFWTAVAYLPAGYWIHGEWPFGRFIVALLGDERSSRRRLILSAMLTTPFYWWTFRDLPPDQMTLVNFFPVALFFLAMYYLLGYSTYWEATGNHVHKVLSELVEAVPKVREVICRQVETHGLALDQKVVRVSEKGVYPLPFDFDVVHSEQIQMTYKNARVILRVLPFGKDLYIRWESFLDLSGRRLWLIGGVVYKFVNGALIRWTYSDLSSLFDRIRAIVLPWGGQDTTGGDLRQTPLAGQVKVPSYMFDELFVLEEVVTGSAVQVLDEAVLAIGRQEKVELSIERNSGPARQAF